MIGLVDTRRFSARPTFREDSLDVLVVVFDALEVGESDFLKFDSEICPIFVYGY